MPDIVVDAARYPIGRFARPSRTMSHAEVLEQLDVLAALPAQLRAAVAGLDDAQLDTPYREGGWTLQQVVHHVADSHQHMATRVRFALTLDAPPILAYDEQAWAMLPDARTLAVEPSLRIVEGVHERLVALLRAQPAEAFARTFRHPENGEQRLDIVTALYAWHSRHHLAHVTRLRESKGW
jgi:uncharacterized damage-inducible protein DinB